MSATPVRQPSSPPVPREVPQPVYNPRWKTIFSVAAIFTFAVGLVLAWDYVSARREDPLNSPQLQKLKEELRAEPASEALKQQIRVLDLDLRQRHFRHISRSTSGVWLLLAGGALTIAAAGRAFSRTQSFAYLRAPGPQTTPAEARRAALIASLSSVGACAAACGLFFGWLFLGAAPTAVPRTIAQIDKVLGADDAAEAAPDCAPDSELNRNWPRFRGPGGNALDLVGKAPQSWDARSGAGILWKVESPAQGFNSPLIYGDSIYLSGGDATKLEVVALRMSDGQIRWRKALEAAAGPGGSEIPETTGYAPCSMATDGKRVYAMFANGYLGAFTVDGQALWTKSFGPLSNPYGHAISLGTWKDKVILQLDQGDSGEGKSVLYALNGRTGRPVWQKPRPVGASWASPILIEAAGQTQIITLSVPWVIAYSAVNGSELWRMDCLNGEVTPSPVFANGLLIVASPSDRILAIRPDGKGDVTKSHMAWSFDENVPDVTSPVSNGELVLFVTTSGTLTCLDQKDGKKLWEHELGFECHASPAISGGKLYQFGQDGSAVIVEVGREYKELFRTSLPDSFHASPAFAQDTVVLRGIKDVWRLGENGSAEEVSTR